MFKAQQATFQLMLTSNIQLVYVKFSKSIKN